MFEFDYLGEHLSLDVVLIKGNFAFDCNQFLRYNEIRDLIIALKFV